MNDRPNRVLVADDQQDILTALRILLEGEGFAIETAESPNAVLASVESFAPDVLLIDLNYTRDTTSGEEGLNLLQRLQTADRTLPVVVMTAWGSVDGAVQAMQRGARDYIEKPWDNARLLATLRAQLAYGRALRRVENLEIQNRRLRDRELPPFITESDAMRPVLELIERVSESDANVLITGEPGTGKEVVARWLHAKSKRFRQPLVTVNAGGIADGVFESEMFGHVKGAFTDAKFDHAGFFERADRGTLFLDEVGNLPAAQQAKLLRVLESGEVQRVGSRDVRHVNVRIVSATNSDLQREISERRFRDDLFYRLAAVEIPIPPLRERGEDIVLLAAHVLAQLQTVYDKGEMSLSHDALEALKRHGWPGNVRELRHAIERAVLVAHDQVIRASDLGLGPRTGSDARLEELTLDEAERLLIRKALRRREGNVTLAARDLGLSRSALYRRLERYGIQT